MSGYEASLVEVLAARAFLHAELHDPHKPCPCIGCADPLTLARALDHLVSNPRDARGVRRIFHDSACMSGCGPESDHADRTQASTAAALRRFRKKAAA